MHTPALSPSLFRSFSFLLVGTALAGLFFIGISSSQDGIAQGPCSWRIQEEGRILPEDCVPDGVAGKKTVPSLRVIWLWDVVNQYIAVFLPLLASLAVALIVLHAANIAIYASNDSKRKESIKAIMWVLFGLLGSTLAYMIITSVIRGFYMLASGV